MSSFVGLLEAGHFSILFVFSHFLSQTKVPSEVTSEETPDQVTQGS